MNQNYSKLKISFLASLMFIFSYSTSALNTACVTSTTPIKFLIFNANLNASTNNIVLTWVTTEESNSTPIEVECSLNGKDFKNIGLVLDGLSNGTQMEYAFKFNSSILKNNKTVYYRVKQISKDGVAYYSTVLVQNLHAVS